jgi:hypothetical protein
MIKSRAMRWAGHVTLVWGGGNVYSVFVENRVENRPLGRFRCKWEDNIKIDIREIGWGAMD